MIWGPGIPFFMDRTPIQPAGYSPQLKDFDVYYTQDLAVGVQIVCGVAGNPELSYQVITRLPQNQAVGMQVTYSGVANSNLSFQVLMPQPNDCLLK